MELQKTKSLRHRADDVALRITNQLLSSNHDNKNIVFSPLSLTVALSVMAAGSQGRTLHELLSFLRCDSVDKLTTFFSHLISTVFSDDNVAPSQQRLSFVNGIWADKSLSITHSLKQLLATHYKATLASVDFRNKGEQVRGEANSWVEKETNGLIKQLLPPGAVCSRMKLIFANALHFKGVWEHRFASRTSDCKFHLLNGTSVSVPFMTSNEYNRFITTFDGFKVLRLSYKQATNKKLQFSMHIFLPDAKDGLSALVENFPGFLEGNLLPQQKVPVHKFMIPKFKISFAFDASTTLKELGVVSPFSSCDADFTNMVDNPIEDKLCVESMFHKASIEVNEQDTEASAIKLFKLAGNSNAVDFVADHPFLYFIREDFTGTILFVGQMLNPLDGEVSDFEMEGNGEEKDESDDNDE